MKSRVNAARMILENYEMEEASGELVCPENIAPDLGILRNAIEEGKRAVIKNSQGYTSAIPENIRIGEEK